MATPYLGEIAMVGFNFPPQTWAFCDGSTLSISQFPALFDLIGTNYGGNGTSNFMLPDLRSRVPVHQNNGNGIGNVGGVETVTLTVVQLAAHSHPLAVSGGSATLRTTSGSVLAVPQRNVYAESSNATFNPVAITPTGGSQPHNNIQPYLAINFVIALVGTFPSRG